MSKKNSTVLPKGMKIKQKVAHEGRFIWLSNSAWQITPCLPKYLLMIHLLYVT